MYSINGVSSLSALWQISEDYLSPVATKSYHAVVTGKEITLHEVSKSASFGSTLLKIASYATLIIPLVALIARSIYRAQHTISLNSRIEVEERTPVFIIGDERFMDRQLNYVAGTFSKKDYIVHKVVVSQNTADPVFLQGLIDRVLQSTSESGKKPILALVHNHHHLFSDSEGGYKYKLREAMLSPGDLIETRAYFVKDARSAKMYPTQPKHTISLNSGYCLLVDEDSGQGHITHTMKFKLID